MKDKIEIENISVINIIHNERSKTYQLKEDTILNEGSARMIVNHLIKKFDLRY